MARLSQKLESSKENVVVRNMSIMEFYNFYGQLKEVLPIMSMLSEKYDEKMKQYDAFHKNMTGGGMKIN